jgi:hypothetical protein
MHTCLKGTRDKVYAILSFMEHAKFKKIMAGLDGFHFLLEGFQVYYLSFFNEE